MTISRADACVPPPGTPFGLRIVVGDVRGHGLEAIELTAAAVTAFQDLAYITADLSGLAAELNARLVPHLNPEDFVTAVFAEFAPSEVRLVNCGHPRLSMICL